MIIGGQAVLLYGEPRMTKDIDITLGLGVEDSDKIFSAVKQLKLEIIPNDPQEFVKKTMVLPLRDKKSKIRVDLVFSYSSYEKQAIENGRKISINKTEINFISLEDLIIHKIIAGRAKDLEDIKNILIKNKNYSEKHIVKWLKEFDKALDGNYHHIFEEVKKGI